MVVNALTKTGKWILYLLAALIILVALLAASVRLAMLYSEDYSEELASLVSAYVGSPVEIGEVDLVWNRFDANANLKDVQIRSADGTATVLALPQIELQLNVRDMLLQRNLSVRSVQLHDLSLTASYEGQGKLRMLGKVLQRKQTGNTAAATGNVVDALSDENASTEVSITEASSREEVESITNDISKTEDSASQELANRGYSVLSWLFNAERISILDSDITLIDASRDREYRVDNVNIRAFNDDDLHQIRISSALPGDIGDKSMASFDFTGEANNINEWKGQFYVNTSRLNIAELSDLWRDQSQQFSGLADVQAWGSWNGTRINKVRVIASGSDVVLLQPSSTGTFNANLSSDKVDIDLDWQRLDTGWQLGFNRLTALSGNDLVQLDGLDIQTNRDGDEKYFTVSGPSVDLQSLRPAYSFIDSMLPNDAPFRAHALRRGLLKDWRAGGIVRNNKRLLTELRLTADELAIDPYGNTPGFSDLDAVVVFENGVGSVTVDNQDISFSLPTLYESPLPVVNVDGVVNFLVDVDQQDFTDTGTTSNQVKIVWRAASEDLRLSSLDLDTTTAFTLDGAANGSREIDLHTTVLNANLAQLKDYYPTKVMRPKLLNWLQTAFVGGDVARGRVEVKGDLKDFAPDENRGHFYAEADVVDATLKFKPDWPAVREMDGNLSFSSAAMRGRVYQGAIRDAKFSDGRLFIPDFTQPILELQANAIGPLADMLDFAQTGPLAPRIGKVFGNSTGSGTSRLVLDAKIPLRKDLRNKLAFDGEVVLDNAQISSETFGIDLESATGNVRFNRRGVMLDDVLVRYQGLPLSVNAIQESSQGVDYNRIRINGPIALASVMQSYGVPLVDQFEGTSNWNIAIDVSKRVRNKKARVELTATSDLSGTEFKLPVPLNKGADELREARIYRDFSISERDWWFELPGLMKTRVRTDSDSKLESMAIALGNSDNNVLPWRGISLHGDAHRVDALGWIKLSREFKSKRQSDGEAFPLFAKINTRQLAIGKKIFDDLVYIAYRDGMHQVHRVENALISGELVLRHKPLSNQPVVLRLDRLDKALLVAVADAERASTIPGQVTNPLSDPRTIPPLDVTVSELKWDNWRLSKVALRTQPTDRGMQITALSSRQKAMRVSGTGYWEHIDNSGTASHMTTLDLTASFDDFGRATAEIANVRSFAEGSGEAALSLSWPNAAYAPDLKAMTGRLLFNLRDGRILSVQPGAGRILGLFALQALPRRLAFDFSDITDTGLEYSGVSGNLFIADGQAQANAIAMSGPVAEILIHGNTGFVDKTYDQTIDVLPRVSGALPLLGVLSGGPAAGVTALLADGVLRGIGVNLDEIGRRRIRLTGSWNAPAWTPVNPASNRIGR